MIAEKNAQRPICHFISMNGCFAERNLRVHPRNRSSAAMTVISETGSGEKRIQRNCKNASYREKVPTVPKWIEDISMAKLVGNHISVSTLSIF